MDNEVISLLRQLDQGGTGVARREVLEPVLKELLGYNQAQLDAILQDFYIGVDGVDYVSFIRYLFEGKDESQDKDGKASAQTLANNAKMAELAWLRDLEESVPDRIRTSMVAHRGFHCINDRTTRPTENTLPAYEQAWSAGVCLCECDVQITSDGHLVLNHDESFLRLALMAQDARFKKAKHELGVGDLSLKQLVGIPMKNGTRPPLLKEVLESAAIIGPDAKLVIEVKPGGHGIARALVEFFQATPAYLANVAVLMSFDPDIMFGLAECWPAGLTRPKMLQLCCKKSAYELAPHERLVDFNAGDVSDRVKELVTRGKVRLDGVYLEWTELMLGRCQNWLKKLCEQYVVGVWQNPGEADCLGSASLLTSHGVSFVNTDFPRGFLREYVGKVLPEDREADTLFASIVAAPDGSAGGVWVERPTRTQNLESLQQKAFDILIIGGGATGLGTALEAMRQGYSVALVERGDFGCGTSSKSSNMIHGGIRYLQAFVKDPDNASEQIKVVRNGLAEQNYMYNCAPYLVRPCPFMVACYNEEEKSAYKALLAKYDELGADDPFPESHWNTKKETLYQFPQLKQEGLLGSFVYYDGQQDDARMALLIALTAIEGGATLSNYVEVESLLKEDGRTVGANVRDVNSSVGCSFTVRAKVVINATGPFTDAILQLDQGSDVQKLIKPAAGTHIVLPDHFSPDRTGLAILETSDGRALFYLPWMGQTIVGTTDHISEIKPTLEPPDADVEWIVKEVNRYLNPDQTPCGLKDVLSAWIGIRPLAMGTQSATGTKDTSAGDTKSVTREHAVLVSESKLVTITGGKWTSYRHMAQDALEQAIVVGQLPPLRREMKEGGLPTFEQGFVGTKGGPNEDYEKLHLACAAPFHKDAVELRSRWHFRRDIAENLIASYGTHAVEVACIARRGEKKGLHHRLAEGYPWILAQVVYGVRRECALHISDILSRRTRLAQVDVLAAYDAVEPIAEVMEEELGWTKEQTEKEVHDANVFLKSCGLEFVKKQRMGF